MREEIKLKINEIFCVVLNILDTDLLKVKYGTHPWDSLAHMNIISSIEEEFLIRLSDEDVIDILNIDLAYEVIEQYIE